MIKIRWDLSEAVVLVDTFLTNWGRLSVPEDQLLNLSEMYKRKATASGLFFDEKYRNLSGLRMQLACVQYVVTNGQEGMPNAAKVFHDAYKLFCDNPGEFNDIKDEFYRLYGDPSA